MCEEIKMAINELPSDAFSERSKDCNGDYIAAYEFCIQTVIDEGFDASQTNEFADKLRFASPAWVIRYAEELRREMAADPIETVPEEPELHPAVHTDDNTFSVVENYGIDHPGCGLAEVAVYTIYCRHAHFPKTTASVSIGDCRPSKC